eukprot:scaffold1123_cov168-Amphora_coffeaeformis.AAC.35
MSIAVTDEIEAWKGDIPKSIQLVSTTRDFVTFKYERTPYVKAKVSLRFPEGYPTSSNLLVTVEGLVPGLNKKLVREMEQQCQIGQSQIQPVTRYLTHFLDTNLFVPCWKEVRKLVDLSKQQPQRNNDETRFALVSLQETKGILRVKFTRDSYFVEGKIVVNPGYPSTTTLENPLEWKLLKTNFPSDLSESILVQQIKRFVRCMQDGVAEQDAWPHSNPLFLQEKPGEPLGDGEPIPSVLPLVNVLRTKVMTLPKTPCPGCQKDLLGSPNPSKKRLPIGSACGCWYHFECLEKFLSEPPFGTSPCPACARQASHPDWSDRAELERKYAQRQAQQRALDDVAMMF